MKKYNNIYLNLSTTDSTQLKAFDFLQLISRTHSMNKFIAKLITDCVKQYSSTPIEEMSKESAKELILIYLKHTEQSDPFNPNLFPQHPAIAQDPPLTSNLNDVLSSFLQKMILGTQSAASNAPSEKDSAFPTVPDTSFPETTPPPVQEPTETFTAPEDSPIDFSTISEESEEDSLSESLSDPMLDGMAAFGIQGF